MRVVFSGSRTWDDALAIYKRMAKLPPDATVVHGDAPDGADAIANEAASDSGRTVETHPADWEAHGKRAGVVRNVEMLDTAPDLVIAFWDGESPGTAHMIRTARKFGIPVEVHRAS